jgi:hypothetical protein
MLIFNTLIIEGTFKDSVKKHITRNSVRYGILTGALGSMAFRDVKNYIDHKDDPKDFNDMVSKAAEKVLSEKPK